MDPGDFSDTRRVLDKADSDPRNRITGMEEITKPNNLHLEVWMAFAVRTSFFVG